MKLTILGHEKLDERWEDVQIGTAGGESLTLRLTAPSLSAISGLEVEIPTPQPPRTGPALRDDDGNAKKDAAGGILCSADPDNPAYLDAVNAAAQARGTAMLLLCMGDQIDFGCDASSFPSKLEFYVAAGQALEDAGLGFVELRKLNEACRRLMGLGDVEMTAAAEAIGAGK